MREVTIKVKPSVLNALGIDFVSVFLKVLGGLFVPMLLYLYLLGANPKLLAGFVVSKDWAVAYYLATCVLLSFVLIFPSLLKLSRTTYIFGKDHFEKRYDLVNMESESVEYNKVVRVDIEETLWDKLTGAADITIHTASEKDPDVHINFVKDPENVKDFILKQAGKS